MSETLPGERAVRHAVPPPAIALVVVAGALVISVPENVRAAAVMYFAVWGLCLVLLTLGGTWRPSAAYLLLFGLLHGGPLLRVAVRGQDALSINEVSWLYAGYTAQAVHLAILGMVAFTVATGPVGRSDFAPVPVPMPVPRPGENAHARITITGLSCLFAGAVLSGAAFTGDLGGMLKYGILLTGFGAVLGVVAGGWVRPAAWLVFGIHAVAAFLGGAPTVVIFAVVTLFVVEARQGRHIRTLWTLVGGVAVSVLIEVVRRMPGHAPVDELAPTVAVVAGRPFADRLFDVGDRIGHVAGSPIAAAYHGFGTAGVIALMAAVGLALGRLDGVARTARGNAFAGVFLLLLLVQTTGT